jgi:hypothetical protein
VTVPSITTRCAVARQNNLQFGSETRATYAMAAG